MISDPKVVALTRYEHSQYAVFMNPTDKRGCRCIAVLVEEYKMETTLNRDYTSEERIGLGLLIQLVSEVYSRIFPISQSVVAGNNAHKFNSETRMTHLGGPDEPVTLHAHIFGRGDPKKDYIKGVPLDGPIPGLNFDMMGKTFNEPGNNCKVKWKDEEIEKVVVRLKQEIDEVKGAYEKPGLRVRTRLEDEFL